jgi:hypothetical protein
MTCTRSSPLAVGESAVFSLNLTATGSVATNLSSQAYTSDLDFRAVHAEQRGTASTNIIAANTADVAIVVSDFPDPVVCRREHPLHADRDQQRRHPGRQRHRHLPNAAEHDLLLHRLPGGLDLQHVAAAGHAHAGSAGTITCTKPTLAVGETASFPLTVSVNSATANGTVINYTATCSPRPPPIPFRRTTPPRHRTLVGAATSADVAIVKTPSANPVRTADTLLYNLRVTNNGPATATNVTGHRCDPRESDVGLDHHVEGRAVYLHQRHAYRFLSGGHAHQRSGGQHHHSGHRRCLGIGTDHHQHRHCGRDPDRSGTEQQHLLDSGGSGLPPRP